MKTYEGEREVLDRVVENLSEGTVEVTDLVEWMLWMNLEVSRLVMLRAEWMARGTYSGTKYPMTMKIESLLKYCVDALEVLTGFSREDVKTAVLEEYEQRDPRARDWGAEDGLPGRFLHLLDLTRLVEYAVRAQSEDRLVDALYAMAGALLEAYGLVVKDALTPLDHTRPAGEPAEKIRREWLLAAGQNAEEEK